MALNIPKVAEAVCKASFQGEELLNVFHFHRTDDAAIDAVDCAAIAALLDGGGDPDQALSKIVAGLDSGLEYTSITVTSLAAAAPAQATRGVAIAGTSGGTDGQAMLALVMRWGTGIASRRFQGRTFFGGLNTGMFAAGDPDHLDPTFRGAMQARGQDFYNAWLADGVYEFVVLSRSQFAGALVPYEAEVVSNAVNPLVGVQRRRRPRA